MVTVPEIEASDLVFWPRHATQMGKNCNTNALSKLPNKDKPKRSRKSAPKVRTGCLTWTRHIKCDEEKPVCRRCRFDRFSCDGYPSQASTAISQTKLKKKVSSPPITAHIDFDISGSALERCFFHHTRQNIIGTLGFSFPHADLWQHTVLPMAHDDESVRHALVALGMAHRVFLDRIDVQSLHGLVLQQYNAAIRHLTNAAQDDATDIQQTLICCLIFFCLESVMGNYAESIQHLRAGAKLLNSHCQKQKLKTSDSSDETINRLADTFAELGVDAGFFLDENLVPELGYNSLSPANEALLDTPFKDLAEARRSVSAIVIDFNRTVDFCRKDWYAPEMCLMYARFKRWAARFDKTTFHFAGETPTLTERHELLTMRMSRKLWIAVIDTGGLYPSIKEEFNETLSLILDEAEALIKPLASATHPVFTLQADIVPPLSYVCELTTDSNIQQRAIGLLRSVKRREGIWDSQEVAEYLADYLLARDSLKIHWDDVAGGLPGSVKLLSELNLSSLSPLNGILRLATQGYKNSLGTMPLKHHRDLALNGQGRVNTRVGPNYLWTGGHYVPEYTPKTQLMSADQVVPEETPKHGTIGRPRPWNSGGWEKSLEMYKNIQPGMASLFSSEAMSGLFGSLSASESSEAMSGFLGSLSSPESSEAMSGFLGSLSPSESPDGSVL